MRSLVLLLVGALVLAGCATAPDPDGNATDGDDGLPPADGRNWATAAETQVSRGEAACAAMDGEILLVGGFTENNQVTGTAELYNASEDAWTSVPDLATPLHHTHVAAVDGRYYVLGGYVGPGFTPTNSAWSWAPGEEDWSMVANLPVARGAGGAAVVDGDIHLAGGVGIDGQLLAQVDVYDPGQDAWSQAPDLPTPRDHLAVAADGDRVVVANGRMQSFSTNTDLVEVLDIANGTWVQGSPAPTARGGVGGGASAEGVIVAGGEASGKTFEQVERYDAAADAWTTLPPTPTPRHGLCVTVLDDGLHVVTGGEEPGFAHSRVHEVLPGIRPS